MVKNLKPLSQYIKDLSFENYAAQKNKFNSNKLELNIDLNIKKKLLKDNILEITLLILLEANQSTTKEFILELSYASTFHIPKQESAIDKKKFAFVYCPSIMFPFVRQIIFNVSQDSGFKPINLNYIDFEELYQSKNQS